MTARGRLPAAPGAHDAEELRFLSDAELQREGEVRMERAEALHVLPGQDLADVDRRLVFEFLPFRRVWDEMSRRWGTRDD